MRRTTFLLWAIMLACSSWSAGQTPTDYNVVFDITSSDSTAQQQVVRDAGLIKTTHPHAKVEIVVYGQGLSLLKKDQSPLAPEIEKLAAQKGVSFRACRASMNRNGVNEADLISGVGTVPDGIYEIISKQRQGWGYIKITQ